jgi:hypothetical protein
MDIIEIKKKMVGGWQFVSSEFKNLDTQMSEDFFGDGATGYLLYTPDGYMSAAVLFPNLPPSGLGAEISGDRTSAFYCGRYTVHSGKVIHHIELSSHPGIHGSDERPLEFIGERLLLYSNVEFKGKPAIIKMLWERAIQD